jgi:hypothetical protein
LFKLSHYPLWCGLAFQARAHDNQRMKLCHGAALALVGWYLMVPPLQREVCCSLIVSGDPSIQIAKWQTLSVFATRAECEQSTYKEVRKRTVAAHQLAKAYGLSDRLEREWKEAGSQATCVASNDPRLRDK